MTKDKLIQAKELDQQIENTKEDIQKWTKATGFTDCKLSVKQGKAEPVTISLLPVGFDTIKGIALTNLKAELTKLEASFKKL